MWIVKRGGCIYRLQERKQKMGNNFGSRALLVGLAMHAMLSKLVVFDAEKIARTAVELADIALAEMAKTPEQDEGED